MWYTLGGNDFANGEYQKCSRSARTIADEMVCVDTLFEVVGNCEFV